MTEIAKIHDHFLKVILARPEDAGTMLRERLPKKVSDLLAPGPPELVDGSFIDGEFRDHLTDRLYRVRLIDGREAFVYSLIEHKSRPQRKVGWQLHCYMTRILEQWVKENPKWRKLPAIIAVVIYHGKAKWEISNEFQALIAGNAALSPYLMNFRFVLVNLGVIDDALLSKSPRVRIGFTLLKYVFRKGEQSGILGTVALLLRDDPDMLYPVILYITHAYDSVEESTIRELVRVVKPEEEAEMMSQFAKSILSKNPPAWVVDSVRQEGEQKGKLEGKLEDRMEMLLDLLGERFGAVPDWARSKIAEADLDTLKGWSRKIFGAEKIEHVFQ